MDIRRLFGANVRRFRLQARLSQETVAERMGVDRANVSSIERGLQNATLLTIWQASQALKVRPRDLFNEDISGSDGDPAAKRTKSSNRAIGPALAPGGRTRSRG